MKRSRKITLLTLGVAAISLTSCGEEPTASTDVFKDVADCIASGKYLPRDCEATYKTVQDINAKEAPRFASKEECEADFGADQCQAPVPPANPVPNQAGQATTPAPQSQSSWMPFMMGYMMGNNGNSNNAYLAPQPVYRDRQGSFVNPAGGYVSSKFGANRVSTKPAPPSYSSAAKGSSSWANSKAPVTKSGGWGVSTGKSFGA